MKKLKNLFVNIKISKKLFFSHGLIFLSLLIISITVYITLYNQKYDSLRINLAAKQRMRIQKLSNDLFIFGLKKKTKKEVLTTANIFEQTLTALEKGGKAPLDIYGRKYTNIPPIDEEVILNKIKQIKTLWKYFKENDLKILDKKIDDQFGYTGLNYSIVKMNSALSETVNLLQNLADQKQKKLFFILLAGILFSIFIFLIAHIISKSISKSMKNFQAIFLKGSSGDLNAQYTVPQFKQIKNEILNTASSYNGFLNHLKEIISKLKNNSAQLISSAEEAAASSQESTASIHEITASVKTVSETIDKQKSIIKESTTLIHEILKGIDEIFNYSDETKVQIDDASSAVEQMAATINSSLDLAIKGDQTTHKLGEVSTEVHETITTLFSAIESVASNSEQIVEMVQLIMDLSEQTNLLAMNAAIEAAHAGEYGKGFAVVAEEIRKLADSSSDGAKKIQDVVKSISTDINKNLTLADKTKQSFELLQRNVKNSSEINHATASALEEQKVANESILTIISNLKEMGEQTALKAKEESSRGKSIESILSTLNTISEEIIMAMDEEKTALSETSIASEHMSMIANLLRDIAAGIEKDFSVFKL